MEIIQLRDPNVLPDNEIIRGFLGNSFKAFSSLMDTLSSPEWGIVANWNYYNDGKAWLCKMVHKKKTVFWLSVWDGCFKTSFYFTEKNCTGLFDLGINEDIIEDFNKNKPIGKLLPLVFEIRNEEQLYDLIKVIGYKKSIK
ncbi:MAG TPA: DUF3788 family protein [Prolixibacteraceae bacterium]|nr:DUF3788 family protein [Prolixibacteraceae bacterium]HPB05687.1 DUF3788 family protein [Prolixibacteraceae bacterium]